MRATKASARFGCVYALVVAAFALTPAAQAADVALTGIFHRPSRTSSAVFVLPNKTQKLVAEGRYVTPAIQLLRIEATQVQIRENGTTRWMSLQGLSQPKQVVSEGQPEQQSTVALTSAEQTPYRDRLIELRSSLERQKDGATRGYKITDARILSWFQASALQAGDVITSVNGNSFSRGEDLEELAYTWRPTARYDLTVVRNGQTLELKQ